MEGAIQPSFGVVDLGAVALVALCGIHGYARRLSGEISHLVGLAAAAVFVFSAFHPIGAWLEGHTELGTRPGMLRPVTWILVGVLAAVVMLLLRLLLRRILRVTIEESADRGGGVAAGLARGAVWALIVFMAMQIAPDERLNRLFGVESAIGSRVARLMARLEVEAPQVGEVKRQLRDAAAREAASEPR